MKNNKKSRQSQYNTMFFTLKLLALFFCAAPIFQYFFKETSRNTLSNVNIMVLIISLLIFSFITFMWLIMDRNRNKFSPIIFCEIFVFLIFCVTSIMFSGMHESYYKFLFVFLVISYTIEMGIKTGVIIATIASAFLLTLDIIMYKESGVNPYFQTDIALCSMFVVIAWILGSYVRIANEHIVQLTDFANLDGLTDLYNHRYFQDCLKQKCEESLSKLKPLSLLIVDIDYFKVYNDIFGHQKGDVVLKQLADILRDNSRVTDIVCRYGGEEFVIILWNTSKEEALEIGENVRKDVELFYFDGQEMLSNNSLTVSVGVAEFYGEKDSADNLINRADSALYRAKFFRRNRVEQYVSVFDSTDLDTSLTSLKSLINVIHSRDSYTYNHVERVVLYCQMYADYYKIPENDRRRLIYGAYLHDLGKINITKETLVSSKKLTDEQWAEMKRHPVDSAAMIRRIEGLEDIVFIVLHHHEKYDGSGYPAGLKGDKIDPLARVLTVADSYDAMTSSRPYQKMKTPEEAFDEITRCKGTHFDPEIAEKFITAISAAI